LAQLPLAQRTQLADLLETWLRNAGVDLTTPPMIGEDDGDGTGAA
jgi:hypothetical protein